MAIASLEVMEGKAMTKMDTARAAREYHPEGFFVSGEALLGLDSYPAAGETRHFHFARHATAFVRSMGATVARLQRRFVDEPALVSVEQLDADGWPAREEG